MHSYEYKWEKINGIFTGYPALYFIGTGRAKGNYLTAMRLNKVSFLICTDNCTQILARYKHDDHIFTSRNQVQTNYGVEFKKPVDQSKLKSNRFIRILS